MDCLVRSCIAATPLQTFRVNLSVPPGPVPGSVTVLVGYRSDTVSLPGMGTETTVRQRFKSFPSNAFAGTNDLGYAVRVVVSRGSGLPTGTRLFNVDFDSCLGAPAATPADFGCTVEGCGSSTGSVDGCTCAVVTP